MKFKYMNAKITLTFALLSCVLFSGCVSNSKNEEKSTSDQALQNFLSSFKNLDNDTLLIQSAAIPDSLGDFIGSKIDTGFYKFINHDDVEWAKRANYNFYGCYKFNLSSDTIALIIRCPSEYWESSLKLFLFNKETLLTSDWIELAQIWGDAGDSEKKFPI